MVRDLNASLEWEKNLLQSSGLISLFEVQVSASPVAYRFLAGYNKTITYFTPGTASSVSYDPFPVVRGEIEQDDGTKIPSMNVNIGMADQEFTSYIENNDALRRNRVRIVTVPYAELRNASACLIDTYYVDGGTIDHDKEVASFQLTSKGQVADVTLPLRRMRRDQCQWKYNASDCLASSVDGEWITARADTACRKTKDDCASKDNVINYGAYPGIGTKRVFF